MKPEGAMLRAESVDTRLCMDTAFARGQGKKQKWHAA